MASKKRKSGRPVGEALGGMLAGFDQQIFRTLPPPHELVQKGTRVRGVAGDPSGGGDEDPDALVVVLPSRLEDAADPT